MPEVSHCYLSAKRGHSQTQDCRSPQRFTTNSGQKAVTTREPGHAPWQGDAPRAGVTGGWVPLFLTAATAPGHLTKPCAAHPGSPQSSWSAASPSQLGHGPGCASAETRQLPGVLGDLQAGGVGGGAGVPREREAGGDVPPLVCGFWAPSCGALGISSSLPSSPKAAAERSPGGFTRRSRLAAAPHPPVRVPPVRVAFVTTTSCSSSQSLLTSSVSKKCTFSVQAGPWPALLPPTQDQGSVAGPLPAQRGAGVSSALPPLRLLGHRGPFTCCPSQLRSAVASPSATVLPRFWVSSQARPAALQGSHPSLKCPASEVMSPQQKWKHLHRHTARPRIPPKLSNFLPELSRQLFRERTGNCL